MIAEFCQLMSCQNSAKSEILRDRAAVMRGGRVPGRAQRSRVSLATAGNGTG
jgi:hypothetical protein